MDGPFSAKRKVSTEPGQLQADKITEEYQRSGLSGGITEAHRIAAPLASAMLTKANARLEEASFEEAAFWMFRAVEGYCTRVFIDTLHDVLTSPFDEILSHVELRATQLLGDSLRRKELYIRLGLLAIAEVEEAKSIAGRLRSFLNNSSPSSWGLRNRLFHSFFIPDEAMTRKALSDATEVLQLIQAPVQRSIDEEEERLRVLRSGRSRTSDPF